MIDHLIPIVVILVKNTLSLGINSAQLHSSTKKDGVTQITYRKTFSNLGDPGDIPIPEDAPVSVIWAIGEILQTYDK